MPTVFVIEQGSYSDYHVVGIYTTREKADVVLAAIKGDDASIAEWPLDPASEEISQGLTRWLIHMRRNGLVEVCRQSDVSGYEIGGEVTLWEKTKAPAFQHRPNIEDVILATVWAKDAEHATKIVNEHRLQWIANGKW